MATECSHDIGRLTRRALQELWRGSAATVTFSPQPFARLCLLVSETVDEIRLSQNVSRVSYTSRAPEFSVLLAETEEHFDHVVVPSGADIEIEVAGHGIDHKQFHFENHHLLIEAASGDRNLSYLAFMADTARLMRHYRFTSTRTMFSGPLPPGLWAPDTYGDLSDNLARLLVRSGDDEVRLRLPFAAADR